MKKFKKIIILMATAAILLSFNQQVKAAETHNEVEPNDSITQAESIKRNVRTPADAPAGGSSGTNFVYGNLNNAEDVDWYKVILYSDQDNIWDFTFTNSDSGDAQLEVYDSNENLVGSNSFDYSLNISDRAFRVSVPTTAIYYLKVSNSSLNSSLNYGFIIGSPVYLMTSYTHNFSSITLTANSSWTGAINLLNISTIPKDAIAYKVALDGGTLASTTTRSIRSNSNSTWKVSSMTPWKISLPVTTTYMLRQSWEVRYNANKKTTSFSPKVTFWYVYPRLPMSEQY